MGSPINRVVLRIDEANGHAELIDAEAILHHRSNPASRMLGVAQNSGRDIVATHRALIDSLVLVGAEVDRSTDLLLVEAVERYATGRH